jgi:hypothetical protein
MMHYKKAMKERLCFYFLIKKICYVIQKKTQLWALHYSDESRKVLFDNTKTRNLLATTKEGRKILCDNKCYNMLPIENLLYVIFYKERERKLLTANIVKYVIDKFKSDHKLRLLIDTKYYVISFGYIENEIYDDHGYDSDGILYKEGYRGNDKIINNICCNYCFITGVIPDLSNKKIINEFAKHKCYFQILYDYKYFDELAQTEQGCLFLINKNNLYEKMIDTDHGRSALIKSDIGRNILLKNKEYRIYLMNCNDGVKLLMEHYPELVYEYKQNMHS